MASEPQVEPVIGAELAVDEVIAVLARRQHGVVARRQLEALGLGRRAIGHRLERGRLHRIHRGVYAVGHPALSADARFMAAVLLGGPEAALSHRSAAHIWELRETVRRAIEVTTPRRCGDRPEVQFYLAELPPDEVTLVRGIPVTTVPRTILDLAVVLNRRQLERAMNEIEVRQLTDRLSLPDLLSRYPSRRGTALLRQVLTESRLGATVTREELEERFLAFLDGARIERPEINAPLLVAGQWFEVDCLWREQRLIVELDGHATHKTRSQFEQDRVRDRKLQLHGWRVVRVTWWELHRNVRRLELDLRTMLATRFHAVAQTRR